MTLYDVNDITELNGTASYKAGGWHTFGSGTTSAIMELLPGNYKFKVVHSSGTFQKTQDLGSDVDIVFGGSNPSMMANDESDDNSGDGSFNNNNDNYVLDVKKGPSTTEGGVKTKAGSVKTATINMAYPNPFTTSTTFEYNNDVEQNVSIAIYDLKGSLVTVLLNETMTSGKHSIVWDSNGAAKGMYFIKLITNSSVDQKSIIKN